MANADKMKTTLRARFCVIVVYSILRVSFFRSIAFVLFGYLLFCFRFYLGILFCTQAGKYYSVNFPLSEGIDDASFESIFKPVVDKVRENP